MKIHGKSKLMVIMERALVVAIIAGLGSLVISKVSQERTKRRDVQRVSNVADIQRSLEFYNAEHGSVPKMTGCIDGNDEVTKLLIEEGYTSGHVLLADPVAPSDEDLCYFYEGDGKRYSIRYVLETDFVSGKVAGEHRVGN